MYDQFSESPLSKGARSKFSQSKFSEDGSKAGSTSQHQKEPNVCPEATSSEPQESPLVLDEVTHKRELTLRQHAFFQLRLHIRKGTNLVAMDRCGLYTQYFSLSKKKKKNK